MADFFRYFIDKYQLKDHQLLSGSIFDRLKYSRKLLHPFNEKLNFEKLVNVTYGTACYVWDICVRGPVSPEVFYEF